jgi:hypothetical protein
MKNFKDFTNELEKDYYVIFTKMYRDFSSTCSALSHSEKKNSNDMNSVEKLNNDFYRDQIALYRSHLGYLFNEIDTDFGKDKAFEIQKYNTREFHFNEILKLLKLSQCNLISLLFSDNIDEYDLKMWFEMVDADSFKQDKIYNLYEFLIKLDEVNTKKETNYDLLDVLTYSFIDNSEYVIDEEDKDKVTILYYVNSRWHEKTDYEIAYEAIKNYSNKDSFEGDIKLISLRGIGNEE